MGSFSVALLAVLACTREQPIERLDRPNAAMPLERAHPELPPPPPPPLPGAVPPPVEITAFLTEAAATTEPWRVTINELAERPRGRRFLGYRITRARVLARPLADELTERLALATSYTDGDVGCVGLPVGIELARGNLALRFIEDCSHVFLTEAGHAGRWALFSSEMRVFILRLREA